MRHLALCVILAGAAGFAGCGGSDSEDVNSPAAERAEGGDPFVDRVDELCKEARPQLASIMTGLTRARDAGRSGRVSLPKTFETFATLLRRASAITERFEARLRSVATQGDERRFRDALLDSVEQGSTNLRAQVRAAERQDAQRLRTLSVNGSVIDAKTKGLIAGHGGFRFCSSR